MKFGALFAKLAGKAGIPITDTKYSDLLAVSTEIPEEDANKIFSSLMTIDEAKQNFTLKSHFTAAVYDGVDQEINKIMDERGLEVVDREELNAEKNTNQRIGKLTRKIADLEQKKAGATGADKKALQDQINQLTTKIGEIGKSHAEDMKRINKEWEEKLTGSIIRSSAAGKKYANDKIDTDVNIETALVILNKEAEKDGVRFVNQNGVIVLKQIKDETLDWLNPANEKPTFEQYFDGVLATKKLLAVNEHAGQNGSANGSNGSGYTPPPVINGDGKGNSALVSANDANLQALEAALK